MTSQKKVIYILMSILVCSWGLEYVFAKQALETIEPLTLVFFKYVIGGTIILVFRLKSEGMKSLIRKKDIPLFVGCAAFGEIGYFYCEYTAMDYLPISLITIILSFVPVLSLLMERILYKRRATKKMVAAVILCIFGVCLVIGADIKELMSGRFIGYLLAFGAAASWNAYNFITASLHERYSSISLTLNQQICSVLLVLPYALVHMPDFGSLNAAVIGQVLYLGVFSGAFGFVVLVKALHVIGVTPSAIFSNFVPVTSTFFGWLFLGEIISPMQFAGGIIIMLTACVVICEKEKTEKLTVEFKECQLSEERELSERTELKGS